jgi:hypothetical protein
MAFASGHSPRMMTQEQKIQTLAVVTFSSVEILHGLISSFRKIAEKVYGEDKDADLETLHALEQLEAVCVNARGAIALAKREFGLG